MTSYRTNRQGKRYPILSKAQKKWVREKTSYLIEEEDKSPAQAYAIANSMARRKHGKRVRRERQPLFGSVAESISKRAG